MSDANESIIRNILIKASEDIGYYNNYISKLFSDLISYNFYQNNTKENNDELIENIKNNIKILTQHIYNLKEKENHDMYRCLSCIYGAYLGDAIGGYCEFKSPSPNNVDFIFKGNPIFGDSPGQVTDDSEMSMCLAYGIMDNPYMLKLNSDYLYYYYGCWYLSHPRDIGFTTRKALSMFKINDFNPNKNNIYKNYFDKIKIINNASLANGFLMRTSTFIVWCYYRFKKIIENIFKNLEKDKLFELFTIIKIQAKKDNICTHPNDSIFIAHSCFCIMSLAAICGYNSEQILQIEENLLKNEFFE